MPTVISQEQRRLEDTNAPAPGPAVALQTIPLETTMDRVFLPSAQEDQTPCQVGDERCVIFLDTETTGLARNCKIIELGMIKTYFSPSLSRLVYMEGYVAQYEDPGEPISELIQKLTGITDDKVAGQRFDDTLIRDFVSTGSGSGERPLIVAHNAAFDKRFCDARFPDWSSEADWACSLHGVDWRSVGFKSRKLGDLLNASGWCFEAHRAVNDVLALAWLFHLFPERLGELLSKGRLGQLGDKTRAEKPGAAVAARASAVTSSTVGSSLVSFGKHKGQTFENVSRNEPGYADWVLRQSNPSGGMAPFQEYLKCVRTSRTEVPKPVHLVTPESRASSNPSGVSITE